MFYLFVCECGIKVELRRTLDHRDDPVSCKCGKIMRRKYAVGGIVIK
jgi:hypothetical protein